MRTLPAHVASALGAIRDATTYEAVLAAGDHAIAVAELLDPTLLLSAFGPCQVDDGDVALTLGCLISRDATGRLVHIPHRDWGVRERVSHLTAAAMDRIFDRKYLVTSDSELSRVRMLTEQFAAEVLHTGGAS